MSGFAAWGLTILGLATVTTLAEILLPQGRTRKVIRSVFATVTVIAIVTPLPALVKSGISFDISHDTVDTDSDYVQYVDGLRAELIARAAEDYLASKGYAGLDVSVKTEGYDVKSAAVKFDDSVMTENGGHINKSEIIKLIADYFNIGEEAVMTYG